MRILVIGGTGLISSSIVRQLVERGDSVAVFNRGQRSAAPPGVEPDEAEATARIFAGRTAHGRSLARPAIRRRWAAPTTSRAKSG